MYYLDYDGVLFLRIPEEDYASFCMAAIYKLFLRRYVYESFSGFIRFKSSLTYIDYKRILQRLERESGIKGFSLVVGKDLKEYISTRELFIDRRARLGTEIIKHDEKLMPIYTSYKAVVDSCMSRKLRDMQMWDSFFMYSMKKSANFSVPGSGKTASVLGVYSYLKHTKGIKRIVVICPKNAFGSWMDEFEVCFKGIEELSVLNIHSLEYKSLSQRRAALQHDSGSCNLILVNYEAVGSLYEALYSLVDANTLLVFDEVHKVKRINGEYAVNSLKLSENACHVIAMTGTPIPNSYIDIYNLLHILYPDEYDEFFGFSTTMLRNPNEAQKEQINDKLRPFFCRTTKEMLGVPAANQDVFIQVASTDEEKQLYDILKMKYRKNKLPLFIRILQLESNPHLLLKSLSLYDFKYLLDDSLDVEEVDYVDLSSEVTNLIKSIEQTSKFTACVNLVCDLVSQGKTSIIWCIFVDSITALSQELTARGIRCRCVYGEITLEERMQILNDFRCGNIDVLLTNPHTLAESVSLHSVCHDAVYFEYSYNLVHLLQSKDRIHRLGLPENQYTQYYYLQSFYHTEDGNWSMDQAVYDRLKEKENTMLTAIDNQTLEALPTSKEDLDLIFEGML